MFLVVRAKRIFLVLCLTIAAIGGIIIYSNRTLVPVFRMGAEAAAVSAIIDLGNGIHFSCAPHERATSRERE